VFVLTHFPVARSSDRLSRPTARQPSSEGSARLASTIPASRVGWEDGKIPQMQVYALSSTQMASETLDLFLTEEAAEAECGRFSRARMG